MAPLSQVIDLYLADRRAKGFTGGTVRGDTSTLRAFLADVGNIQSHSIAARHLDIFWAKHSNWQASTANRAKNQLSGFFKWCRVRGHMARDNDPLEGTRARRVALRDRVVIPVGKFPEVLEAAPNPRDRAVVALGLYLFCRVSEIRLIKWQDVDFDQHIVRVTRPKTGTQDDLPMCEELEDELRRWRLTYSELAGKVPQPSWYVTPRYSSPMFTSSTTNTGERVRQRVVSVIEPGQMLHDVTRIVKGVLAVLGYDGEFEGGHTLRRSGAIALYNELAQRGHDRAIRMCQAMLGHSSIQTTEVYLRLDLDRKTRNDLLAGHKMFSVTGEGKVVRLGDVGGQGNGDAVHVRQVR